MIKIEDKSQCCGCTACASICANDAITMQPDALGFLYPVVDEDKCTDCGLCEKVCAFNDHYDTSHNLPEPSAYAARHKDMREIETSRSGAAFIALSDLILAKGGVVYGCGYKDHFRVAHKRAVTKQERNEFKGSKYVQSDLSGVFHEVRRDLKNGLLVMFSGTPCQTSGLASYIGYGKMRDNLFLVDIVCHGVPGPFVWRDYIAFLEKKHGSEVCWVNFRDKQEFGWRAHRETFKFLEGGGKMSYTYLFYRHIMFRHSCGVCHFTNTKRPSDITIADFWGWEKTAPDFNADDKGCSLVLVNTEKGRKLFEEASADLHIIPAKLEDCLQTHLRKPSDVHPMRMKFEEDYATHGFEYVYRKYGDVGIKHKVRTFASRCKKKVKKVLKSVLPNGLNK